MIELRPFVLRQPLLLADIGTERLPGILDQRQGFLADCVCPLLDFFQPWEKQALVEIFVGREEGEVHAMAFVAVDGAAAEREIETCVEAPQIGIGLAVRTEFLVELFGELGPVSRDEGLSRGASPPP